MKKLVCLILAGIMMLAAVACGSEETKKVVMTYDDGETSIEYIIEAEGDKVKKIRQTTITDMSAYAAEDLETIEPMIEQLEDEYNAVSGLSYSGELGESELVEKFTMDVSTKSKIQAIAEVGAMDLEADADFISLEKTIEQMEELGFTVVE